MLESSLRSRKDRYFHRRKNGIYYVEFINPETGKKMSAKSTGETDKLKAQVKAEMWKINGIPTGKDKKIKSFSQTANIDAIIKSIRKAELNEEDALQIVTTLKTLRLIDIVAVRNTGDGAVPFIQFLENFWDYDTSAYIRDKLNHGFKFGRTYARGCQFIIKSVMKDFFGDKKLNCITTNDLERLSNLLSDKGYATSTINQMILICQTPLRWCYKKGIIPVDPSLGLTKFSITNKERGILTEQEMREVFNSVEWKDKRAYVASLVSATTGARRGEILALRPSSIIGDFINIAFSYSPLEGLKSPKNGKRRDVFLQPFIREALMELLKDNPHEIDDPFFFYSYNPNKPCNGKILQDGFNAVMKKLNINYKERYITFHSLRHWFSTTAHKDADARKVMKATGHLSESVFQRYGSHFDQNDIREVGAVMAKKIEKIIPFPVKPCNENNANSVC